MAAGGFASANQRLSLSVSLSFAKQPVSRRSFSEGYPTAIGVDVRNVRNEFAPSARAPSSRPLADSRYVRSAENRVNHGADT